MNEIVIKRESKPNRNLYKKVLIVTFVLINVFSFGSLLFGLAFPTLLFTFGVGVCVYFYFNPENPMQFKWILTDNEFTYQKGPYGEKYQTVIQLNWSKVIEIQKEEIIMRPRGTWINFKLSNGNNESISYDLPPKPLIVNLNLVAKSKGIKFVGFKNADYTYDSFEIEHRVYSDMDNVYKTK